jgi:hypothetical protein
MSITPPSDHLVELLRQTLATIPDWVRTEFAAKNPVARARAEEVLAAMIEAAIHAAADSIKPLEGGEPT